MKNLPAYLSVDHVEKFRQLEKLKREVVVSTDADRVYSATQLTITAQGLRQYEQALQLFHAQLGYYHKTLMCFRSMPVSYLL